MPPSRRREAVPWPDGSFDIAFAFNVLHLVDNQEAALRGVHRLLRPGGLFISKTPSMKEMNPLLRIAVPLAQLDRQGALCGVLLRRRTGARDFGSGF